MIAGYVDKLIYGQEPGFQTDVSRIQDWINAKDLSFNPANIAKQIYLYGSSIYQQHLGADSGLFADVDFDAEIEKLNKTLFDHYAGLVSAQLDIAA
jgi:hypothetical protein